MKIIHAVPNYYPSVGGIQKIAKQVSERLVHDYQDEVTVITTNAKQSTHSRQVEIIPEHKEWINGVQVYRFPYLYTLNHFLRLLLKLNRVWPDYPGKEYIQVLRNGPISYGMLQAVRHAEADIILISPFNYLHMYYPCLKGRKPPIPLIYMGALHLPPSGMVSSMILRAIQKADAYIAFTHYEQRMLIEQGIQPEKIHVIGLGIDPASFTSADALSVRTGYKLGDAPLIMFLGRQTHYKGIDTLLYAMARVWEIFPNAYLLIGGSFTDFSIHLQSIIAGYSEECQRKIIYLGQYTDDVANLYAACDLFVTVSSQESFGIVYLEAWMSKKPVIGGRIGSVASVIDEGENGLLVTCGDVDELASAIIKLLSNEEMRKQMGEKGFLKVTQEHTWEIVTRKFHSVYESVLDKPQVVANRKETSYS